MPFQITCTCGKCFTVPDARSGGKGRCPTCSRTVDLMPQPAKSPLDEEPEDFLVAPNQPEPVTAKGGTDGRIRCPSCAEEILAEAKKCKHCGEWLERPVSALPTRRQEATARALKRKAPTGPGVMTYVCLLVVIAGCTGVCIHGPSASVVEKRKQVAEKRKQEEAAQAERWRLEESKQPERRALIQKLIAGGAFQKVDFQTCSATAWVGPSFYLLSFEDKQSFCSVVYAYVYVSGKGIARVTLKDAQSGKEVGNYSQHWGSTGLKME